MNITSTHICINEIFSIIDDLLLYLEKGDPEEYKTNHKPYS